MILITLKDEETFIITYYHNIINTNISIIINLINNSLDSLVSVTKIFKY